MILKKIIISTALLICTFTCQAQFRSLLKSIDEIEFSGGPALVRKLNINITKDERQIKIGYVFNLGAIHELSSKFSLNTNLTYERKGYKGKFQTSYYDPTIDFNNCKCTTSVGFRKVNASADYFVVALRLRYQTKYGFYLSAGPYVGHILKAKVKETFLWDNTSYTQNGLQDYKKIDFGLSVLLGYKIRVNSSNDLNLQLFDNYGLINTANAAPRIKITNNLLAFTIGLNHKIG